MANIGITGGGKLGSVLADIAKVGKPELRVGFLAGKTEADGTPVPLVAFWNEFGTKHAPPRPFFRNMVADKGKAWPGEVAKVLKATGYDGPRTLLLMGERIKGQLQQSIVALTTPPLAASTILRKGGGSQASLAKARANAAKLGVAGPDKPLIDTGTMLNSVDYVVTDGSTVTTSGTP
jgi:hypothetical protein